MQERTKKLLTYGVRFRGLRDSIIKSFLLLFFKKEVLSSLLIYGFFGAVTVAPIFAVDNLGLGDYLNHLARMHILAGIGASPDLQRFYQVAWAPIPYLAMDAVVPLLAHVLPIYVAGKVFVAACMLLPVVGVASVHAAVYRRFSLIPAAAFLFSANFLLSLGFLNYLFSLSFALLLFACWIATAKWPRWPRAAAFAPFVVGLYFGHAFACGAYCLCVAGWEIARGFAARFRPFPVVAADVAAAFAQAIPALGLAFTLRVSAGYVGALTTEYGNVAAKFTALISPELFLMDRANAWVIAGTLAACILLRRQIRIAPALRPAIAVVAVAAIAMPHVLVSTWGTDLRLPLVVALLLVGAASLVPPAGGSSRPWRAGAAAALTLMLAAKSADAWVVLRRVDRQIAETRQVLAAMPRGARLLVVNPAGHGTGWERVPMSTIWHMPLVAVIDRDAFVPTLFNGLTTVHVRPAFRLSSTPNGLPITPAQLWEGLSHADPPGPEAGDGFGARLYHFGWPQKFDFVLVQRFGFDPGPLPRNLTLVSHAPDMDLYSVNHG